MVGTILLGSFIIFVFLLLNIQQDFYYGQVMREADRFSSSVINATNHSMLEDDRDATRNIIDNMGQQEGIWAIRIYDHDGRIKFSSKPIEVGSKVDKQSEACFVCHSVDKPFNEVFTDQRTRLHYQSGYRVLGMITPISIQESCYTAECHVHSKDQNILGVLDVGMSLKWFDDQVKSLVLTIVLIGIGTFIAVFGLIGAYIAAKVNRPISRLRMGAKKIAAGDYTYKVPVESTDQIGELAQSFNVMRDQIRRRTIELVRSRWEYKNLFEQVPCFICLIDGRFDIVRQNSYMRELFRGTIGMKCYEVFKQRKTKCDDCHVDITFQEGKSSGREHCGLKVTGEETNYLSYTTPVTDEKGKVIYAMLIAVDISDRIELQNALRASQDFQTNLIEHSIHGIIATDEEGKVNIYNIAAQNMFGYSPEEVIGDGDLEKYFPKSFVETILSAHMGREVDESRLIAQETIITSNEGESIPVRFSGFLLFENKKIVGAVGFLQDLRTFKKLEREKLASDRLAVAGQTVAGLAHGIKNILTGLEGGVFVMETAMEDHDDQLLPRGWSMVRNNIGRVSALVKDLLSYSKERAPQYEETDPNLLAEEVCALFEVSAQEKSIEIRRDFDPQANMMFSIYLDQRGIHTCLSNLIANAIDACAIDAAKSEHRITVRTKLDPEGYLEYEISDNGIGMSDDTKRKLFSSFYSTKGSRGTGLGLLVTSKIIAEHGGRISFESIEGVGSTFVIMLPPGRPKEKKDDLFGSSDAGKDSTADTRTHATNIKKPEDSFDWKQKSLNA
jgi:PAS domain S-box-containing protein